MKLFSAAFLLLLALSSAVSAQTVPAKTASVLSLTPQQLSNLRLHDGFTLTYQGTLRDVRTAALRKRQVVDQQNGIKKRVAEGHMTASQAQMYQTQALTLGLLQAEEHFTITLSARDGKLLYLSTRNRVKLKDGSSQAIVLDGPLEYESVCPAWIWFCRRSVRGRLPMVTLTFGAECRCWSALRLFQDHWIAAQMQMTEYEGTFAAEEEPLPSNLPLYVNTYTLLEAKPEALASTAFEIGTYLRDEASVADASTGRTIFFAYDRQGGTLKEQAEAAAKK